MGDRTKADHGTTGARRGSGRAKAGDRRSDPPDKLADYHRKRDFDRTSEPSGGSGSGEGSGEGSGGEPRFVIQHHAARADHYDVRLEVDGVLKSWAVPKGPSTDPRDKRLAVPTEDHPLDYAEFEGTIPKGDYGGGTVLVWDAGTYTNTTHKNGRALSMEEGLRHGHVSVDLNGEKLSGGYALNRFRTGAEEAWLLVKEKDGAADARRRPTRTQPESVRTGRDLDQVAREAAREQEAGEGAEGKGAGTGTAARAEKEKKTTTSSSSSAAEKRRRTAHRSRGEA